MTLSFYEMMIEMARDAAKRARWIFTAVLVLSLIQLFAVFNLALSSNREFVQGLVVAPTNPAAPEALKELQHGVLRNWLDTQKIDLGLLGMEFDAADVSSVGPVAFAVALTWLFYAMRRENHLMGTLLKIARDEPQEIRAHVFHALNSSQVFATLSHHDGPFTPGGAKDSPLVFVRLLAAVLTYLPALTIACAISSDIAAVFLLPALFRGSELPLVVALDGNVPAGFWPFLRIELVALLVVWCLCFRVSRLQQGTQGLLRQAQDEGWGSTEPQAPPPEADYRGVLLRLRERSAPRAASR